VICHRVDRSEAAAAPARAPARPPGAVEANLFVYLARARRAHRYSTLNWPCDSTVAGWSRSTTGGGPAAAAAAAGGLSGAGAAGSGCGAAGAYGWGGSGSGAA
jgi:hypothetical protein